MVERGQWVERGQSVRLALRELPAPRVPRERKGRPEAKVQQARWAQLARQ